MASRTNQEMSDATARKLLRAVVDKEVLCWHGNSKRDPDNITL